MHDVWQMVLVERDLTKAGLLFDAESVEILADISSVITGLVEIVGCADYSNNDNDVSVVEICLTRLVSAIRETNSLEEHTSSLVLLLDACTGKDLSISQSRDLSISQSSDEDPSCVKIATDIMNFVFTKYDHVSVMRLVLPVACKLLSCGHDELCGSLTSNLALAAISHTLILSDPLNLVPIMDALKHGNYGLLCILIKVHETSPSCVESRLSSLVNLLEDDLSDNDLSNLIQLLSCIANSRVQLFVGEMDLLLSKTIRHTSLLDLILIIANQNPDIVIEYLSLLLDVISRHEHTLKTVTNILTDKSFDQVKTLQVYEKLVDLMWDLEKSETIKEKKELRQGRILSLMTSLRRTASVNVTLTEMELYCGDKEISKQLLEQIRSVFTSINESESKEVGTSLEDKLDKQSSTSKSSTGSNGSNKASKSSRVSQASRGKVSRNKNSSKINDHILMEKNAIEELENALAASSRESELLKSADDNVSTTPVPTDGARTPEPDSDGAQSQCAPIDTPKSEAPPAAVSPQSPAPPPSVEAPSQPPELHRDAVQHFCEKHLTKIKTYVTKVSTAVPIPSKCSITGSRSKRKLTLKFGCTGCSPHCLYQGNHFLVVTKIAHTWAHLMVLNEQSKSPCALNQEDPAILHIKENWSQLKLDSTLGNFTRLVTSSFPSSKDQESVIKELYGIRFFDLFEYNQTQKQWVCFICNNPEKVDDLIQDGHPAIEGQLQEKKGKWRFFKRWKTRYFTLSGAHITYSKKNTQNKASLPVAKIQSVKALRKGAREIPKAFEIFTSDQQKFVLKPKDGKAEQWVQCLQIAVAQSHSKDNTGPSLPTTSSSH